MSYKIKSYAKVNLSLEVLYKRKDNFHEINTIFYKTKIHDLLHFSKSAKYEISLDKNIDIPLQSNLIYKAAQLLQSYVEKDLSCSIKVEKNIPTGGGLGGGSSNAAYTLLALNDLFDLKVSKEELSKLAAQLGSDVPFFLYDKTCVASGRGEIISEIDFEVPYHMLLINPGIHISTPEAYKSLNRNNIPVKGKDYLKLLENQSVLTPELTNHFKNDFEEYVFKTFSKIYDIKNALYENDSVFALMSGSGSTVFGMFYDVDKMEKAKRLFSDCYTAVSYAD